MSTNGTLAFEHFDSDHCNSLTSAIQQFPIYYNLRVAFIHAKKDAEEQGNTNQATIYQLLENICSMTLSPDNSNQPYKPSWELGGKRSPIPDDLTENDLQFLKIIVPLIENHWLKARLADLIWIQKRKGEYNNAIIAIDSYIQIPLNERIREPEVRTCWYRAIDLTKMLGGGAGNRLENIQNALFERFDEVTATDRLMGVHIARLLDHVGLTSAQYATVADKLVSLAQSLKSQSQLLEAKQYFESASRFYAQGNDSAASANATYHHARCHIDEAENNLNTEKQNNLLAADRYEKAIQLLRSIPAKERTPLGIDELLIDLHRKLKETCVASLEDMKLTETQGIDISQLIKSATDAVTGKNLLDALAIFVSLSPLQDHNTLSQLALELQEYTPISSKIPVTAMSIDARVIHKSTTNETSNAKSASRFDCSMQLYNNSVNLAAQSRIIPALNVLKTEHYLSLDDFHIIASNSSIVPPGRERLFAKGLYAGYNGDYVTALHLLTPQVENMVRYHLNEVGVTTSTLDLDGIMMEIGLSSLLEKSEVEQIFGEEISYEICALFCHQLGSNFRNNIAHGLAGEDECNSLHGVYTWWFVLRLVFMPYFNALKNQSLSGSKTGDTASAS